MVVNILPADTPYPPDPRDEVNRSRFHFFGTWPCCILNLKNLDCSNTVPNILTADPLPPSPRDHGDAVNWPKFNLYIKWSC